MRIKWVPIVKQKVITAISKNKITTRKSKCFYQNVNGEEKHESSLPFTVRLT